MSARLAAGLHYQSRMLNVERMMAVGSGLRLQGGGVLLKIRSQNLLHWRRKLAVPANGEYLSLRRDVFVHYGAFRRLHLVNNVGVTLRDLVAGIHVGAIGFHRGGVATERGRRRQRTCKEERSRRKEAHPPPVGSRKRHALLDAGLRKKRT